VTSLSSSVSAQERNRDVNDPGPGARVRPRRACPALGAPTGSFTSRFRVSSSEREVRAAARQVASDCAARNCRSGCRFVRTNEPQPCGNAGLGSLVSVAAFAYAGVMYATAVVGGKVVRFKLSPTLARAHRQTRGASLANIQMEPTRAGS
jgi:hypothetical protein